MGLSHQAAAFPGLGEFAVAFRVDLRSEIVESIRGGDVADRAVKAHGVVMDDEIGDELASLLQGLGALRADATGLQGLVKPLDLSVRLRIVRAGSNVSDADQADEFLEITGNELSAAGGLSEMIRGFSLG